MQERIYLLTFLKSASMADALALSFSHYSGMSYGKDGTMFDTHFFLIESDAFLPGVLVALLPVVLPYVQERLACGMG